MASSHTNDTDYEVPRRPPLLEAVTIALLVVVGATVAIVVVASGGRGSDVAAGSPYVAEFDGDGAVAKGSPDRTEPPPATSPGSPAIAPSAPPPVPQRPATLHGDGDPPTALPTMAIREADHHTAGRVEIPAQEASAGLLDEEGDGGGAGRGSGPVISAPGPPGGLPSAPAEGTAPTAAGGCDDLAAYRAGGAYDVGDHVLHDDRRYACHVAGWCSSDNAAYEPGTGFAWTDAWDGLGACFPPPEVRLSLPRDGRAVLAGVPVAIAADANDPDGDLEGVEFFVDGASVAGVVNRAPYAAEWIPAIAGASEVWAVATDARGNVATSSVVDVFVEEGDVVVSLSPFRSGQKVSFVAGGDFVLVADVVSRNANRGDDHRVDFKIDGRVIASLASPPYSATWAPEGLGMHTVTAEVTDVATGKKMSDDAVITLVNRFKLIGYWHNFVNGAGCPLRLADMSDAWDVVDIAFADNDRNADGTVHFNLYSGGNGCPGLDPAEFKRDMAALQAKGKVFVLSLGGAEGDITLKSDRDEANFVASLTGIIDEWGFDGLDVDLESGSGLVVGSSIQTRLGRALLRIEANMGRDMYLTMAPEHPYVHGGYVAYSGAWGAYLPIIDETRRTLDLLHVQLYNNGGLASPYLGRAREGTVDMMVAHAMMLVEGFDISDGSRFVPLRDDQVAIGLPSGPSSANSGQAPTQNILDALDCLTRGSKCGSIKPSFNYDNFGGVMTWSINWDKHDEYNFSGPIGHKLEEMNSRQQ